MSKTLLGILAILLIAGCENTSTLSTSLSNDYSFDIKELTDEEYPDNPDIGYRSDKYGVGYFKEGEIVQNYGQNYDLIFRTFDAHKDSIVFPEFDLMEYIPTIPQSLKSDDYLSYLTIINQEWNRNQVKFSTKEFDCNNKSITRVDVARNCLNAYLWEVIAYTDESGKELPIYHGWFNFPKTLYADLFEEKNGVSIEQFLAGMERWKDPKHAAIKRELLQKSSENIPVSFTDQSDAMYPVKGERERKYREIITPTEFSSMRDLQNDKTTFATFSEPGFYNRKDPRTTELGRFYNLEKIQLAKIVSAIDARSHHEVILKFKDKDSERETILYLGGLDFEDFPKLSTEEANNGWKTSMGFANHTFYEDCQTHEKCKSLKNPYYGYLTNGKDEWLDSHQVGIDGPLIHWDDKNPKLLHIWILSFERHALVGHYTVQLG